MKKRILIESAICFCIVLISFLAGYAIASLLIELPVGNSVFIGLFFLIICSMAFLLRKWILKKKSLIVSLAAAMLGLAAGAVLIALISADPLKDPAKSFYHLFSGGLMRVDKIGNTLAFAAPLVFTGLAVAFAFRTGLFNIGGAGQMVMGGLCATLVALWVPGPQIVVLPIMFVAAALGGALWAAVPGLLKARFNVHEVVSTIMMNWVASWAISSIIPAYLSSNLETESAIIPLEHSLRVDWLTWIFTGSTDVRNSPVNIGFFLAVSVVILIAFILNRTTLGYELKAVGFNRHSAEYTGMPVTRNIVLSMMISGGLAGLAGLVQYCGYALNIAIGSLPNQGYDGIAVALLGANSPWGVAVSALFFGIMQSGKAYMNAITDIPPDIADTIIAIIIYFAATSVLIERVWDWFRRRKASKVKGGAVPDVGNN